MVTDFHWPRGLPEKSAFWVKVFSPLGQQVAQLVNGEMEVAYLEVMFASSGLTSGIYFYAVQAGDFAQTKSCYRSDSIT